MNNEQIKYWSAFPALLGGAFLGLLGLLTLRVVYYSVMNYQPNMAPQIAYYLSPILLIVIMLIALPIEFLFRFWHAPTRKSQAFIIGIGYSTLLPWWAFPAHWQIFIVLNPILMRWLMGLLFRSK